MNDEARARTTLRALLRARGYTALKRIDADNFRATGAPPPLRIVFCTAAAKLGIKPLRDLEEAQRVWLASEKLTGISFGGSQHDPQHDPHRDSAA